MYDIFFVSLGKINDSAWSKFKARFPNAQKIDNCDSFSVVNNKSLTKNFWIVWDYLEVADSFDLTYRVTEWDNQYIHVFKNGMHYDGICLFPKNADISRNEWKYRFFTNKKEIDVVASTPVDYNIVACSTYEELLEGQQNSTSDYIWAVPSDVNVLNFPTYQVPTWEKDTVHIFKNATTYDGVFICHKNNVVSKREFEHRFFINKKEIDIIVSNPTPFEIYQLESYQDYVNALSSCKLDMFWGVYTDLNVNFNFDYYIPKYDSYHRKLTHVFLNGIHYDGVVLFSKERPVTEREFNSRFYTNKKDVNVISSTPELFDIVFISYQEPNAEKTFAQLQDHIRSVNPKLKLKRVHGVKGIHQAHIAAARLCSTNMFWVVDGDSQIVSNFKFDYTVPYWDQDMVHVWRSKNPVNDLEYGYGGTKLLPTQAVLDITDTTTDMTTSLSSKFKPMPEVSNVSVFNTDPYSTWKSAFRECCKLASRAINRQEHSETDDRLDVWTTEGYERPFGKFAVEGAIAGRKYGIENSNKPDNLRKINDFNWLQEQFDAR